MQTAPRPNDCAAPRLGVPVGKCPDTDIIRHVLSGETDYFELLMRRYNQRLFRVIRTYVSDRAAIEDIMQEAYIKAYTKLDQFRGEASFSTWLIRIGINEALRHLRKKRPNVDSIDDELASARIISIKDNDEIGPENRTIMNENRHILEEAIDQLPEKYKIVFMMREIEGMSHAEVAEALELSESNAKVRLHRAKSMLRTQLYRVTEGGEVFTFGNEHCDRLVERVMERIR